MHVILRFPFERPRDFVEPPKITIPVTQHIDEEIRRALQQQPIDQIDWPALSKRLDNIPPRILIRHAVVIHGCSDAESKDNTPLASSSRQAPVNASTDSDSRMTTTMTHSLSSGRGVSVQTPTSTPSRTSFEEHDEVSRSGGNGWTGWGVSTQPPSFTYTTHPRTFSSSSIQTLRPTDACTDADINETNLSRAEGDKPIPDSSRVSRIILQEIEPPMLKTGSSTPSSSSERDDEEVSVEDRDRAALEEQLLKLKLMDVAAFLPSNPSKDAHPISHLSFNTQEKEGSDESKTSPVSQVPQVLVEMTSNSITALSPQKECSDSSSSTSSLKQHEISRSKCSTPVDSEKPSEASSPNSNAHTSVGSSFSDISDSSVTHSAMIDAMMSQNVNASKMSIWSRR